MNAAAQKKTRRKPEENQKKTRRKPEENQKIPLALWGPFHRRQSPICNVGPLSSFNSLVYHMGSRLDQVRDAYAHGKTPQIALDFRNVKLGVLNVPALAAFLSTSKKLKDYLGYPIPLIMNWDPNLQGFLADIGFIEAANHFRIFEWEPNGILGGYKTGKLNPLSGILYYSDKLTPSNDWTEEDYIKEKELRKRKIAPNFLLRCSKIFESIENDSGQEEQTWFWCHGQGSVCLNRA